MGGKAIADCLKKTCMTMQPPPPLLLLLLLLKGAASASTETDISTASARRPLGSMTATDCSRIDRQFISYATRRRCSICWFQRQVITSSITFISGAKPIANVTITNTQRQRSITVKHTSGHKKLRK